MDGIGSCHYGNCHCNLDKALHLHCPPLCNKWVLFFCYWWWTPLRSSMGGKKKKTTKQNLNVIFSSREQMRIYVCRQNTYWLNSSISFCHTKIYCCFAKFRYIQCAIIKVFFKENKILLIQVEQSAKKKTKNNEKGPEASTWN